MKNYFLILIFFFNFNLFSQENDSTKKILFDKKHEVRFEPFKTLSNGRLSLTYEYFLKNRFSFGLSTILFKSRYLEDQFENSLVDNKINDLQIIPFVRFRISKSQKNHFYVENFINYNSGKYNFVERIDLGSAAYYAFGEKTYSGFAIGASIGYKFYIVKRIPVDFLLGVAGNVNAGNAPSEVARIGIQTGYRF